MADAAAQAHADVARRARRGASLVLRGMVLNLVLATAKFAGGIFGHTYALIADGVESLADVGASLLVWLGFRWAAQPPDDDHPYGHGKAEALAGLVVALGMLLAAGWIAIHAVRQIISPHQQPEPWTLLLLVAIITTKVLFSLRMHRAGRADGSNTLRAEAWHHISDAITSGAAFLGILIAVLGGPAYAAADAWAALVACAVVAGNGWIIGHRAVGEMMDLAPPPAVESAVRHVAGQVRGVHRLEKCRVRKSGLSHLVDIHVEVNPTLTVGAGHDIARAVKYALLQSDLRITDVLVQIEPAEDSGKTTTETD